MAKRGATARGIHRSAVRGRRAARALGPWRRPGRQCGRGGSRDGGCASAARLPAIGLQAALGPHAAQSAQVARGSCHSRKMRVDRPYLSCCHWPVASFGLHSPFSSPRHGASAPRAAFGGSLPLAPPRWGV